MSWLEIKYTNLLSSKLEQFEIQKTNPLLVNFRCPLCGDSAKNKAKKRGYIYQNKKGNIVFKCHNCGKNESFSFFLKEIDQSLFKEYSFEKFKHDEPDEEKKKYYENNPNNEFKKPAFIKDTILNKIPKISQLKFDHPAKLYVLKRKIPNPYHAKLFYCSGFYKWVNSIIPEKFKDGYDEPRLIIPLLDPEKNLIGFQGRSFDPKADLKYITIMLDSDKPKVFNWDTIDFEQKVYYVEGCIDAMFIPNTLALVGADFTFGRGLNINPENSVFVMDNEPRNLAMIERTEKLIDNGYQVCIWPSLTKEKDINDMIMIGKKPSEIKELIDEHTYKGLGAKMTLQQWRRV